MPVLKVLILGGTTEARELASACAADPGIVTVSSLAGRTSDPRKPVGDLRTGGFGGAAGLAGYLRSEHVDAVIDATHPFAFTMTAHALSAAAAAGVPLLVIRRPGWTEVPGDRWHRVPSLAEAAALVPRLGSRVFLTTGRQTLESFAGVTECWFLSRSVEAPEPPVPPRLSVLLDRGPFSLPGERDLLKQHAIDVLVTKDSGGVAPKLTAARELGVPVVMIDRPAFPSTPAVTTAADALAWIRRGVAR